MRRLIACALAAAVSVGSAGPAFASRPPPKPPPPPRLFLSPCGEPFRLGPGDPDPLKAWFDQADSGHLGYIDQAEFRADAVRFFKKLDENGDGIVDGFEVADYEAKVAPELTVIGEGRYSARAAERQAAKPTPQRRHGRAPQDAAGPTTTAAPAGRGQPRARMIAQLIDEPEPVSGADFNLDSRITMAEWMRATDERFDILDTAHTGRLTLEALRTIMDGSLKPRR